MALPSIVSPAKVLPSNEDKERVIKSRLRKRSRKDMLVFWSFVAPLAIGLIAFFYIPILWSLILSFADARATITPTKFVGLENYQSMLTDTAFIKSLVTFILFAVFIVPLTFISSLALALLVNSIKFAQGFFRSVFFLPTACSYVVASLVWKMSIFSGLPYGLLNSTLESLGIIHEPINWVSSPTPPWYWLVLVSVRLWLQIGIYMIIFIAGLQDVPRELYEASFVDGAKRGWQTFWNITFPLLRNASVAVLLLNVIAAFQAFDEFYNVLQGGNQVLARPPLVYLYTVALNDQDYGRGSAGAIILILILMVFTLIQGRFLGFGKSNNG